MNRPTMSSTVEIDEIDVKILRELIKDARTRLKDIAKACGVSSSAIFTRLKRLKTTGVITGAVQFVNMGRLGYLFPASIGINLNPDKETIVMKLIRENFNIIVLSQSVGKNDLIIFLALKSIKEIERLKQVIRKQEGIRKISVNLWSTPRFNFENIDLQSTGV